MSSDSRPILFIAYANDRVDPEQYLRNLVQEARSIRRIFEDRALTHYRLETRANASLDDIIRVFDQNPGKVQIFHYAGHAGEFQLMLESDQGHKEFANFEGFTRLLAQQEQLRFVFLNGCVTYKQAEAMADAGIPAVISTSEAISDHAALAFAERFYNRMAAYDSVEKAFQAAEIRVQTALMTRGNYRTMYWEGKHEEVFPWRMYGKNLNWQLQRPPSARQYSILPLMCDRDAQVELFRDSLEKLLADSKHPPFFYLIHGLRADKPQSLVERFKEVDIRYNTERLFGVDTGIVQAFDIRDWPYTGDLEMRQRNLKRTLARGVHLPGIMGGYWDAKALVELMQNKRGAVTLQHNIFAEKWDNTTLPLLKWYIDKFWTMSITYDIPQFIIFINIIYPEENQGWIRRLVSPDARKKIIRQLEALVQEHSGRTMLLDELGPISYGDVVKWVEEFFPDQLNDIPNQLFGKQQDQQLSMEIVEDMLKAEVERLTYNNNT